MNKIESLGKASKELMLKEPFYGLILMALNKMWDVRKVPTAGVTLNGVNYELVINSEFWENLDHIQKLGLLKHELLHIAFFHLTDFGHLKEKRILNIAMDIEINQYIERSWLPENGCFIETFIEQGMDLEPRKGTRYYYDKLLEEQDSGSCLGEALECLNGMGGEGECTAIPGKVNEDGDIELPDGTVIEVPEHTWDDIEELDEATQKLIKSQTGHIIKQVAEQVQKSKGNIPGEFEDIIKRLNHLEPAKFDWKGYMRRFVGKSTKTYTKKSRRKFNKRLPDFPGLKIKRHKHILAAIDTSGSVSIKELNEFLNELHHLKKTGSEVTICQCDTAISYIGKFDPRKDLNIHGRGGTDFQPVIDYYNEKLHEYSCLFYFTDGECNAPENAKGNILWVISSNGNAYEEFPGTTIKLEL